LIVTGVTMLIVMGGAAEIRTVAGLLIEPPGPD
jgi:hypothetical protein